MAVLGYVRFLEDVHLYYTEMIFLSDGEHTRMHACVYVCVCVESVLDSYLFETGSHYVTQNAMKLWASVPLSPRAVITSMHHQSWLKFTIFL